MNLYPSAVARTAQIAAESVVMPARILIVEDEGVLAKNMKRYLSRGASEVRTAADAAQAFEILESFAPDALILDFGLPGVDGLRIYAEIVRRQQRKIDCLLITGNPTSQLTQEARELGIRHIVGKPFRISELQRFLETPRAAGARHASEAKQ